MKFKKSNRAREKIRLGVSFRAHDSLSILPDRDSPLSQLAAGRQGHWHPGDPGTRRRAVFLRDRQDCRGTVRRNGQRRHRHLPHCGATTPKGYIAAEAQQGRLGHQLYCVILNDQWQGFTKAGQPKKRLTTQRSFRTATPDDDASIQMSEYRLSELAPAWDDRDILPTEEIPEGNKTDTPRQYGLWNGTGG